MPLSALANYNEENRTSLKMQKRCSRGLKESRSRVTKKRNLEAIFSILIIVKKK